MWHFQIFPREMVPCTENLSAHSTVPPSGANIQLNIHRIIICFSIPFICKKQVSAHARVIVVRCVLIMMILMERIFFGGQYFSVICTTSTKTTFFQFRQNINKQQQWIVMKLKTGENHLKKNIKVRERRCFGMKSNTICETSFLECHEGST